MTPPNLPEWLQQNNPESYDSMIDFAKAMIKAYREWSFYDNHHFCAICGEKLSKVDFQSSSPSDFIRTCRKHVQFRNYFQIDELKIEHGFFEKRDKNFFGEQKA